MSQTPFSYRLLQGAARLRFYFHTIRVLESRRLERPAILVINAPESLQTATMLTAAFNEPLLWVFNPKTASSFRTRLAAHYLGALKSSDPAGDAQTLERISDGLRTGALVALFHDMAVRPESQAVSPLVKLLLELGDRWTDPAELVVLPVDVFAEPQRPKQGETLLAVGEPLYPREHIHRAEGNPTVAAESLDAALHSCFAQNAFSLSPSSIQDLEEKLEDLLRADLRVAWAGRPNWRQSPDDFELSGRVRDWIQLTNTLDPTRLVSLAESVAKYRHADRRWSERAFAAETAGDWIRSPLGQSIAWTEAVVGLPIALYGLLNHWIVLVAIRVFEGSPNRALSDPRRTWAVRGGVLLAVYAVEILVCDRWLGRAAAGYYALTLPLSGLYLWRYVRLWQSRIRRLLFKLTIRFGPRRLQQMRRRVALELDRHITASTEQGFGSKQEVAADWPRFS